MFDRDLLIRFVLGSPCLILGHWMFTRSEDPNIGMLGLFPCLLAFALIMFPSSNAIAARAWSGLFLPQEDAKPRPVVSRAQQLRFNGRFEESLAEYEHLLREFPHDLDLWAACFEITWVDLHDRELAVEFHRKSLRATEEPEAWKKLNHRYLVQARRHPEAEEWADEERVAVERRMEVRARAG